MLGLRIRDEVKIWRGTRIGGAAMDRAAATAAPRAEGGGGVVQKGMYSYTAPWPVYALNWSRRPGAFRLGIASFKEDSSNQIEILQLYNRSDNFVKIAEAEHTYPVTRFMWSPYTGLGPDLFATSGDHLRIWELVTPDEAMDAEQMGFGEQHGTSGAMVGAQSKPHEQRQVICRAALANVRRVGQREYCAPLTSFDWNDTDPSLCVTSSVDTTCTVWDVQAQQAKTQLIAHDKEVYDVAFAKGVHIFASVGADGSVRMFDLRSLEHSTIIYETQSGSPGSAAAPPTATHTSGLLRLAWNKQDPNYIATFQQDSNSIIVLDIRVPAVPVTELHGHFAPVTSVGWAPHSSGHICSAADDGQALVWDISQIGKMKHISQPLLAYCAESEVNQLAWSSASPEWIAISHGRSIQALRV